MEPLAPIVDRVREHAREELPVPRTCKVSLWDDGTYDVLCYHSMGSNEGQSIRYERTTGEIVWRYVNGSGWKTYEFSGGETLHEPTYDEYEVRVLETIEPPYE